MAKEETFTDFEVDLDLSTVDAWDGEQRPLVPAGDYALTVINMTQESGPKAPYFAVTFEVAEGEHSGSRVYNNYSTTQNAIGRLKALMVACGTQLDKVVASQFVGRTILATVVHVEGEAKVDTNGNPLPAKIFANVSHERPMQEEPQAAAAPPPVLNKNSKPATAGKTTTGAPRRA